jgi:hypothetical protein
MINKATRQTGWFCFIEALILLRAAGDKKPSIVKHNETLPQTFFGYIKNF